MCSSLHIVAPCLHIVALPLYSKSHELFSQFFKKNKYTESGCCRLPLRGPACCCVHPCIHLFSKHACSPQIRHIREKSVGCIERKTKSAAVNQVERKSAEKLQPEGKKFRQHCDRSDGDSCWICIVTALIIVGTTNDCASCQVQLLKIVQTATCAGKS